MGDDVDTPNLTRIIEFIRSKWMWTPPACSSRNFEPRKPFTYVSGLEGRLPFTHLTPVSAAYHPMLAQMADAHRTRGLPIHIVHGALDWMFPVELARQANRALSKAGAMVTYREIDDLSHTYPREVNVTLLEWLEATPSKGVGRQEWPG